MWFSFWGVEFWRRRYSNSFNMKIPLYETQRHASNYPPQHQQQQHLVKISSISSLNSNSHSLNSSLNFTFQANDDSKGTLLSLLSLRGNLLYRTNSVTEFLRSRLTFIWIQLKVWINSRRNGMNIMSRRDFEN